MIIFGVFSGAKSGVTDSDSELGGRCLVYQSVCVFVCVCVFEWLNCILKVVCDCGL